MSDVLFGNNNKAVIKKVANRNVVVKHFCNTYG